MNYKITISVFILTLISSVSLFSMNSLENELLEASKRGDLSAVQSLVRDKGVNIDCRSLSHGITPLMFAAFYGRVNVVKFLVKQGANVNAANAFGETPLVMANMANSNGKYGKQQRNP